MTSKQRSLLVTGGAGFIGSNFLHFWRHAHPADSIVVLDALTYAGNRRSLASLESSPSFTFVQGNIVDQDLVESLLRRHIVDTVVHFAAESHVDRSILGPDKFIETNVIGTHSLLKACRTVWLDEKSVSQHRFHHISTDEVFGSLGPMDEPFQEKTPYAPNSPYAASKAASDHLVRAYARTYGLQSTTTNCSNNYGPYHFPEKLIPMVIVNILLGRKLPIYGDGRNIRDWLFVGDHCHAIELALDRGRPGETYNIGGSTEIENIDLVRMLCAIADELFAATEGLTKRFPEAPPAAGHPSDSLIQAVEDRPGHDRRYAMDCRKAERELSFNPRTTLNAGLRNTFLWYLSNESWWRGVMDGSYRDWIEENYGSRRR